MIQFIACVEVFLHKVHPRLIDALGSLVNAISRLRAGYIRVISLRWLEGIASISLASLMKWKK